MRTRLLTLLVISLISIMTANSQSNTKKTDPVGTWNFEAPAAPDGFTSGTMVIAFTEKKYSSSMIFTGNENKFSGDEVKFENNILSFSLYIEGQNVSVTLKPEAEKKMSGKAVYSEGEIALTLTRSAAKPEAKVTSK